MSDDLHKWFVNISCSGEPDPMQFMQIGPGRFLHKDHRHHPVVGMGRNISSHNFGAYTSFEGWMALNLEPSLVQLFNRADQTRQILDVWDATTFRTNIGDDYLWDRPIAEKWVSDLMGAGLITDRLRTVILRHLGFKVIGGDR